MVSLVLDLDLLVVSLDRLKESNPTELISFLNHISALDRLAKHRAKCWEFLDQYLDPHELEKLEEACASQQYWTSRS